MGKKRAAEDKSLFESPPPPATLEAALAVIENMRSAIESTALAVTDLRKSIEQKDSTIEELQADISGLEVQIEELEEQVIFDGEAINDLACIEQKMKRGRPEDEIRGDLDRLLQRIDCGGTHRLAAVPVML